MSSFNKTGQRNLFFILKVLIPWNINNEPLRLFYNQSLTIFFILYQSTTLFNLNKHLMVNTKLDVCAFYNLVDAFPNRQKAFFLFVMIMNPKSKILIELKLKAGGINFYYIFVIMMDFMESFFRDFNRFLSLLGFALTRVSPSQFQVIVRIQ